MVVRFLCFMAIFVSSTKARLKRLVKLKKVIDDYNEKKATKAR